MPIVDPSADGEESLPDLSPEQVRRIHFARQAAVILRRPPGVFGSTPELPASEVAELADYLEHGLRFIRYDIDRPDAGVEEVWVPTDDDRDPMEIAEDDLLDPERDGTAESPPEVEYDPDRELIIIKARDLRAGDRSPDWRVIERLALDPEDATPLSLAPSQDRVLAQVQWNDGTRGPRSWEAEEDIGLIERGPVPNVPLGEPDADIAPR